MKHSNWFTCDFCHHEVNDDYAYGLTVNPDAPDIDDKIRVSELDKGQVHGCKKCLISILKKCNAELST